MGTMGNSYDEAVDGERIRKQHEVIRAFMLDGIWRSLAEISGALGYPESSVSAQLRHLRKEKFGGYIVDKRRRGAESGTWEYRVQYPPKPGQLELAV